MNKIKEADILDKAKLVLEDVFKGELTLVDENWSSNRNKGFDGHLLFNNDFKFAFTIISEDNIGSLKKIVKSSKNGLVKNIVFILKYTSPDINSFLKENDTFFIDASGNCYINLPTLKVHVEGRQQVFKKLPGSKVAFQKAGLKLIYQLLVEPELTRETYRNIAKIAGISSGSAYRIFEELEKEGFVIVDSQVTPRRGRSLSNVEMLITKWAMSYAEVLRPKIHRGYFRSLSSDLASHIVSDNSNNEIYFGGPLGASHLNKEIVAQKPILFSNIRLSKMAEKYRIVPTSEFRQKYEQIEVLEVFWNTDRVSTEKKNGKANNLVDPILIYADLIASNDFRSREAAKNILKNEIRDKFRQYNFQW